MNQCHYLSVPLRHAAAFNQRLCGAGGLSIYNGAITSFRPRRGDVLIELRPSCC